MSQTPSLENNLLEVLDRNARSIQAVSYLADRTDNTDLCGLLMILQENMEDTQQKLQNFLSNQQA